MNTESVVSLKTDRNIKVVIIFIRKNTLEEINIKIKLFKKNKILSSL